MTSYCLQCHHSTCVCQLVFQQQRRYPKWNRQCLIQARACWPCCKANRALRPTADHSQNGTQAWKQCSVTPLMLLVHHLQRNSNSRIVITCCRYSQNLHLPCHSSKRPQPKHTIPLLFKSPLLERPNRHQRLQGTLVKVLCYWSNSCKRLRLQRLLLKPQSELSKVVIT